MNILRRRMLHPLRSRHNPLTRAALFICLFATLSAVTNAASELISLRELNESKSKALAEMFLFLDGKVKMVEQHGQYAVEYSVTTNTFEVK